MLEDKVRLAVNQQRIQDTQTMVERPRPTFPKGPISLKPSLETILEVSSQKENAKIESKTELELSSHISM